MSDTITEITRQNVKEIGAAAKAALEEVAESFGLVLKPGSGSYDPGAGTFSPKFTFALADSGKREFDRAASLLGLSEADFGRTFVAQGKTFTITGINLKAPKYPVLAEDAQGKTYKFPEASVKTALAAANANGKS